MTLGSSLSALSEEQFVLVTTFRRSGTAVATPVWVARSDGHVVVSTPEGTGKVKRLAHTDRVQLQACSRRGAPLAGAPVVEARATVSRDPGDRERAERALLAKYSWQWRVAMLVEKVVARGRSRPRPVLLIESAAPSDAPASTSP